jgi:hypothetical protein
MYAGSDPYHDLGNKTAIWNAILEGPPARPKPSKKSAASPTPIPDHLWKLLLECWSGIAAQRPSINKIVRRIEKLSYV